jgi:putative ABC transport system permease protein
MNKKLFSQIKNEWRTNLGLAIELLLVSVVMWWIADSLYCTASIYFEPRGFDTEHCYLIEMDELTDKSPDYTERTNDQRNDDIHELANRLRQRPEIESVSLSFTAYPYNGSNSTINMQLADDTLKATNWVIRRAVSPDFVKVFRYEGARGETPEQLAEILERDEIIVSDNLFTSTYKRPMPMTDYVGRRVYLFNDTTHSYPLGASVKTVRYGDFQSGSNARSLMFMHDFWDTDAELCVRVRANQDVDFIERLKADSEKQLRVGNIYISNIRSFKDLRRDFQQGHYNKVRDSITIMAFLLVNIFLGLLGTFWFRTQQRKSEIALHKAHGATNQMVFTRLLSEGWLLLLIVTPIALAIDFNLAHAELNSWRNGTTLEWDRLLFCGGISFALIALMIAIGIGIPARKAMKIDPAEALHNE